MNLLQLSLLVMVLIGAVGLALTNPTTDDYLQYIEVELGRAIDRMDPNTQGRERELIKQIFRSQGKKLLESVVRPTTTREDWGLMSRYETNLVDTKVIVVGIGHQFVPIEGVEEAVLKIGRMVF